MRLQVIVSDLSDERMAEIPSKEEEEGDGVLKWMMMMECNK